MHAGVGKGSYTCPATRDTALTEETQVAHKAEGPSHPPLEVLYSVLSGPLALCLRTLAFQVMHKRGGGEKGGGSTFVIAMVQLASSRPPRLQTGVTSPPATEANMPRELHLHLPGSPEKGSHSLQLTGQHSFQYFAGTFRMQKTLKSHQSPCQAEPLAHLPLLSIHCQRAHQTHGQALRIQKTNSTLL